MLNTSILQGLTVGGNTSLSKTVITGATDINLTGSATTTIGNSAAATNVSGTFTVVGLTKINETGAGNTTIGNAGSATTALNSVATTVGGTLGVTGLTTLSGGATVTGTTTQLNSTTTTVGGTLGVTGLTTLSGGATVTGTTTQLNSTTTTVGGTLGVTGLTTLSGGTTVTGTTLINSTGSANTTIGNTGTITLNGTVNATGLSGYATTTALNLKANIANPTFTGTVTIPAGALITGYAPTASPTFTGSVNVSTNITGILQNTYNLGIGRGIITNNVIDNFASGDLSLRNKPLNSLHVADVSNTIIRIGPMGYQGTAANTTEFGLERSRHSIVFSGFRDHQQDLIGTKISSINKQTFGGGTQHLIQSSDMAFFTQPAGGVPTTTDATVERMRIKNDGNVGIGYTDPSYPLDVNGQIRGTNLAVTSDRRIKTNIVDVEDDAALQLLRRLKPKTYTYKDTLARGTEPVYGFIAQEVREVLNYSTSITKDALPNIYESATLVDDILTLTTFNTSDLSRDASGSLFSKIKIKPNDGKEEFVNILEVIDEHTLKVDTTLWSKDSSGNLIGTENLFVYGQEVNDFHNLNKDAIWTVATAALQEVDRQLQAEKQKTATLETTLASVQEAFATLVAKVNALEQR